MKITIDNNERVFQIVTDNGKQFFCNLEDIPKVITSQYMIDGYYTIYHFWDNKPKKITKKLVNEMLQLR